MQGDFSVPQFGQYPSQSYSSNNALQTQQKQIDLLKQQQDTLKNLQQQRKDLEARSGSFNGVSQTQSNQNTDFLDFSVPSVQSVPSNNSNSQIFSYSNNSGDSAEAVLGRLSSFMKNVESKLDLLSNSVRQLDLDIQLAANKQDRQIEQMSSAIQLLEKQAENLQACKSSVAPSSNVGNVNSFSSSNTSFPQQSAPSSASSPNDFATNGSSGKNACPVCSLSFSQSEIHAHIESHFNEGSRVTTQQPPKEEETGFWSKIFTSKKKEEPKAEEIAPPTYNYSSNGQSSAPMAVQPAFYSPTGTVQYAQPQNQPNVVNNQQFYYPMAPRN